MGRTGQHRHPGGCGYRTRADDGPRRLYRLRPVFRVRVFYGLCTGGVLLFFFLSSSLNSATAAPWPADSPGRELAPGHVAEIIDGDTLILEDGREVRLVGLQAPKLPLGRKGFRTWPLAQQAKEALAALSLGRKVRLFVTGNGEDRYGRILAHVVEDASGLWLQGTLLEQGWARVYSFADNRALVGVMLGFEQQARDARRGIWNHPFYRVLGPDETDQHVGKFAVVEGRVVRAANVRGTIYLNFSEDWRSDFTIRIPSRVRRQFETHDMMLERAGGWLVQVRGWIKKWNGPMIELTHPEQLGILRKDRGQTP